MSELEPSHPWSPFRSLYWSSCFDLENPKAKQQGSARRSKKGVGQGIARESFRDPVVDEKSRLIIIWSSFSRAHGLNFEHWTHFRFPVRGALSREPTSQRAHRELSLKEEVFAPEVRYMKDLRVRVGVRPGRTSSLEWIIIIDWELATFQLLTW